MSIVLLPFVSRTLLYSVCLYSNRYSNADEQQRYNTTRNEQNRAVASTKWTRANTSEQRMSSPPFGSSEYLLRTPPELKRGYKMLEAFLFYLYTATAATAQEPNYQRSKEWQHCHL
jgi:hypothetical protein